MTVSDRCPLMVFGRVPEAGRAKTRLAPQLGQEGAALLYEAFLRDTLRTGAQAGFEVELWVAGDPEDPRLDRVDRDAPRRRQPELDLGGRMAAALAHAIDSVGSGLVLGSDLPTLPATYLGAARQSLRRADVVLGPSADGGYYLVGARNRVPPLFEGVRWSSRFTLADTLALGRARGVHIALIPPWYDVDTPADLSLLRAHLSMAPSMAPATAQRLGL